MDHVENLSLANSLPRALSASRSGLTINSPRTGGSRLEADTNGQHQLLGDSQFEHDIRASFLLAKM
jgi:hypothetical protein